MFLSYSFVRVYHPVEKFTYSNGFGGADLEIEDLKTTAGRQPVEQILKLKILKCTDEMYSGQMFGRSI